MIKKPRKTSRILRTTCHYMFLACIKLQNYTRDTGKKVTMSKAWDKSSSKNSPFLLKDLPHALFPNFFICWFEKCNSSGYQRQKISNVYYQLFAKHLHYDEVFSTFWVEEGPKRNCRLDKNQLYSKLALAVFKKCAPEKKEIAELLKICNAEDTRKNPRPS